MECNYITKPSPVEGKRTSCWRLFNKTYQIHTTIKIMNHITGTNNNRTIVHRAIGYDAGKLQEMYNNQRMVTAVTPVFMTNFIKNGFSLNFKNLKDAAEIYHDINDHINNWINALSNPFINRNCPELSEFILLDDLAARIFTISNNIISHYEQGTSVNSLDEFLMSRGGKRNSFKAKKSHASKIPQLSRLILK